MASEGCDSSRAQAVADVASRFFGTLVGPKSVIDESLQRATDDRLLLDDVRPQLAQVLTSPLPDVVTDDVLHKHPLAVWAELAIGLEDGQELRRKKPIPFADAVSLLSKDSGVDVETCRSGLETFLTRVSLPERERGGSGEKCFPCVQAASVHLRCRRDLHNTDGAAQEDPVRRPARRPRRPRPSPLSNAVLSGMRS
jgi:hypothetical protein